MARRGVLIRGLLVAVFVLVLVLRPLLLHFRSWHVASSWGAPVTPHRDMHAILTEGRTGAASDGAASFGNGGGDDREATTDVLRSAEPRMEIPIPFFDEVRRDLAEVALAAADESVQKLRSDVLRRRLRPPSPDAEAWEVGKRPPRNDAPVRACFITLVRHTKGEVIKLHRLLVNVREMLPLMAARYPFVVFHESAVTDEFLLRLLLDVADEHIRGERSYPGTRDDRIPHGIGADIRAQRQARQQLYPHVDTTSEAYAATFSHLLQLQRVQLEQAVAQFIFPAGVEMEALSEEDFGTLPRWVQPESVKRWPYPSTSFWGVSYRHMCRFYGSRLFTTRAVQALDFDYYMRLDVDSFILSPALTTNLVSEPDRSPAASAADYFAEFLRRRYVHQNLLSDVDAERVLRSFHRLAIEGLQEASGGAKDGGAKDSSGALPTKAKAKPRVASLLPASAKYGFVMLHPQTQPVLMEGLWEAFDEFMLSGLHTSGGTHVPLSPFSAARGVGLHYWDNFEIMDAQMFRMIDDPQTAALMRNSQKLAAEVRASNSSHANPPTKRRYFVGGQLTAAELDFIGLSPDLLDDVRTRLRRERDLVSRPEEEHHREGTRPPLKASAQALRTHVEEAVLHSDQFWADLAAAHHRRIELAVDMHNSRQRAMLRFTDFIDKKGGYYYHRWGDAEVRTLMISLFIPPSEILYVQSLPYQHYHNFHCPNTERAMTDEALSVGWQELPLDDSTSKPALFAVRRTALSKVQRGCEESARRDFGPGSKQRGTASMDPAERPFERGVFLRDSTTRGGWTSI